jgi:4-amino-4-deoxy-L-arabinose transferase-like glycosyltransferase
MTGNVENRGRTIVVSVALALLLVLIGQLAYTSRANSITWDEGHHLFDGYNIWKQHDYGLNPEVPPLVKMVAAAPLLRMHLVVPPLQGRSEQTEAFLDGKDFVFHNNADKLLFRARMAASVFMIGLAVCVFFAAYEMFGPVAALLALAFLVFDPNFLAHGALVTTDAAISCCIFLALYLAYRYAKRSTPVRLLLVGLATGLAMAAKFTGLLIPPILLLLVLAESLSVRDWRLLGRRIAALVVVGVISFGILWSFYGFRYSARPAGRTLNPPLADYLKGLPNQQDAHHLALLARTHLLPEAYLFGLANTKITEFADTSYFFGHIYRHGTWLYFPAAFVIKSTLPFLLLLATAFALIAAGRLKQRRELFFLLIPPALFFAVAMHSTMNIGHRHILPIYPFLYVLIAAGAAWLIQSNRRWSYAIAVLLLWQIATSVRVAPAYMAYANEAWGGPSSLHKYLGDANTDWGQQLKAAKRYLDNRGIKNCWFAYFADGVVDTSYYGIPCKRLPTVENTAWLNLPMNVPPEIDGPVLISDGVLAGIDYGQGALNPYQQFRSLRPTAAIDYGLFVYDGHFKIPLAFALAETQQAQNQLAAGHPDQALTKAQQAAAFAPDSATVQIAFGDVLMKLHRTQEAETHYQQALHSAQTIEPELQADSIPMIEAKLATARSH